jgi:hypothetical protein
VEVLFVVEMVAVLVYDEGSFPDPLVFLVSDLPLASPFSIRVFDLSLVFLVSDLPLASPFSIQVFDPLVFDPLVSDPLVFLVGVLVDLPVSDPLVDDLVDVVFFLSLVSALDLPLASPSSIQVFDL